MPETRVATIPSPLAGVADYRLIVAERAPGAESFLFIPQSEAPGLTIDLIRIDLLPRRFQRLRDLYAAWLARLTAYAGPSRPRCEIASESATEIVFHFSFADHPVAGAQHTVGRLMDLGVSACAIQALRKFEPLAPADVAARIAFVRSLRIDLAALRREPVGGSFVEACLAATARLHAQFQRMIEERKDPEDIAALQDLVIAASPLHATLEWASLAKIVAADIVDDGRVAAFATARRMLGLAALALDDARATDGAGVSPLDRPLVNTLDLLAELLLYAPEGDHVARVSRPAGIWRFCAARDRGAEAGRSAQFELRAAFAEALAARDLSVPLDAGFGPATIAALHDAAQVERMVDWLRSTSRRMAHVSRRFVGERALRLGACVAADLAQFVVERAVALDAFPFDAYLKHAISVGQWQLDAQLHLFGITQADLDKAIRTLRGQGLAPRSLRPSFVYLRPLSTARRELVPNCFPSALAVTDGRHRLLPERISIEAALQVALNPAFAAEALGGPLDVFGMTRSTVLGAGGESWRGVAGSMIGEAAVIGVLPAESEGLSWELGEILRQGAAGKTMFVLPPRETAGASAMTSAARRRLAAIGYQLPARLAPGFVLLTAAGACERHIPFDWLWDGRLRDALWRRLRPEGATA